MFTYGVVLTTAAAAAGGWGEELSFQLCEFGLQLSQVKRCCFILLSFGHLGRVSSLHMAFLSSVAYFGLDLSDLGA